MVETSVDHQARKDEQVELGTGRRCRDMARSVEPVPAMAGIHRAKQAASAIHHLFEYLEHSMDGDWRESFSNLDRNEIIKSHRFVTT